MREFLLQFMGEDAAMGVQFLVALLVVLLLFGIFIWILRLVTGTSKRPRRNMNEQRLAVLDRTQIDENRSLLLVRRDDVEHLVMVGGPSDVVVEANINLDDEDEIDGLAEPHPGHEVARRVIAQRPLRTMSLASSSATVAESIGHGATSLPEATIAPPATTAVEPTPLVAPIVAPKEAITPEPTQVAEIPSVEVPPEPVATIVETAATQPASAPEVAATPAPAVSAPQPVAAQAAPAVVAIATEEPQQIEPVIAAPVEVSPAPRAPVQTPEPNIEMPVPKAAPMPDLAAHLEDALSLELDPEPTHSQATSLNEERAPRRTRSSMQQQRSMGDRSTMDDQILSRSQDADLSAGFAAAMSLDMEPSTQSTPTRQTVSEGALEDAIADMLRSDSPTDTSTYNNGKNDVYSSSESVPSGSERLVDTTRPGRVDDEMSRLLQELAVPGRA
ncbi:MAG: hypothetical protein AB8B94_04370 [Hyphomicrobiales bacterium]